MPETEPSAEFEPPFLVTEPARQDVPFVFSVPHAGSLYPEAFLASSCLGATALRRSEDAYVDRLFAAMVPLGAPVVAARFPRAYLDVNREPYELDPRMFEGPLPPYANTRSMRVAGGLGTIPRIVADGHEIYGARLPVGEALGRIERLYKPYHRALRALLKRTTERFGHVVLIDAHSMPSASPSRDDGSRADVVLGDRYGTSCAGCLTDIADMRLRQAGYSVLRNKPYAGGFITEHYGAPAHGRHALQIEISRSLYMDERTLLPNNAFADLAADLGHVFGAVMRDMSGALEPHRIAAE